MLFVGVVGKKKRIVERGEMWRKLIGL